MPDKTSWALVSVRIKSNEAARCTVFARRHQFDVGQPITFDREDPEVSAMEYLAAAVASDLIGTFRKVARRERLLVEEIEAVAQGELKNALTYLGVVGEEGEPSLQVLTIKLYVGTGASSADVNRVWEAALKRSPLYTTLSPSVAIEADLQISY